MCGSLADDEGVVCQREISSRDARPCNWLERRHGLDGYILTWSPPGTFDRCVAGKHYGLELAFTHRSAEIASLWLHFLQSKKQRRQESNQSLQTDG